MVTSPELFERIYERRFSAAQREAKARIWKVLVADFFQKWIDPDATVLDLGCGHGEFLNAVRSARRIGVDLNPRSPEHLDSGIEFHEGSVWDLGFLTDGSVDLIFTSNLLEHLAGKREVERTLREVHRVLKANGVFVAMGPNLRFLAGPYWDFWDHHVPITDRSLVEILEVLDFEVIDCVPRFLPYTSCSVLPQGPGLVRWYLRMPIAWRLFGKQFLVRAKKRARSS